MPDTFLIDRRGKIAASYIGMVDRANVEENIRAMLARK
jgi:peroxiredoxin